MTTEELQEHHKQVLKTPSYLKSLEEWQLQELLLFSNEIVSKKRKIIRDNSIDETGTTLERDIKREKALQQIIKTCIDALQKGKVNSIDFPAGLSMYGSPDSEWYEELDSISRVPKNEEKTYQIDYEEIKLFCHDDFGLKTYQRIKDIFEGDEEATYFLGLKVVTHLAETAGIFDEQPFKALNYIKSYLSNKIQFKAEISEQITEIIVEILQKRDEDKSSGMKLIINELKQADFKNPDTTFNADLSQVQTDSKFKGIRTEFFGVDYIDVEMWVKGTVIAYGLAESKEERVKKFLDEHRDEVKRQLKKNHNFVESLNKQSPISNNNFSNQHIKWRKGDDSLEQFIEALQEHGLIKSKEVEAIIKDHFKPVREKNNKPEPIEWIYPYKNLLAYLIRELHNNRYIACKNIWQETESHFSIDGEIVEGLRKSEDQYANRSKTGKPSSHEIVDEIINNLSN